MAIVTCLSAGLRKSDPGSRLVPEFGLPLERARIDLAKVSATQLAGFEIKGSRDDLSRLSHQVLAFESVFEELSLVVAQCHVARAHDVVPPWWGIARASDWSIEWLRPPLVNPESRPEAMARLLWRDEAARLARALVGRSVPGTRRRLIDLLAREADADWLSAGVRSALRQRTGWRSAA
jgi:hypothetical protein